jgi:hypothetical protein
MGSGFLDLRTGGYRTSEAYGALTRGSPDGFPAAPPSPVSLVRWQARPEGWSTSPLHRIYGQSNGRDRLHCDLSPTHRRANGRHPSPRRVLVVVPVMSITKLVEVPPRFVVRSRKPDLGDEVILLADHSADTSTVAR